MDHARSDDPVVQQQLDRLSALGPGADVLGLDRITRLLARLGDPHRALPPVFHVAGTNGKGSTCAFLRGALEAAGYCVHVYTSPHLVRFNERIRIAGQLIDDRTLGALLTEVMDAGADIGASFFEVTTAAAFLAFSRHPADACIIEVGLGGRLDATNVIPASLVGGIARLGIDHQAFLGDTLTAIAREKAGIARRDVPLVALDQVPDAEAAIADVARASGARLLRCGHEWTFSVKGDGICLNDGGGMIDLPLPAMPGSHQQENLSLTAAMLRAQDLLPVPVAAIATAARTVRWPARMEALRPGPLLDRLPQGSDATIDGAHNLNAAQAAAQWIASQPTRPVVVLGILANKDAAGILDAMAGRVDTIWAVPVPDHGCHAPTDLVALAQARGMKATVAPDVGAAFEMMARNGQPVSVLVLGSLYLAGAVLAMNDQAPI